ncbi:unnamed protein product [Triticum turgidum subsp. durum]|uniref:Uncharacterized protein n=1 Tax=Triticum turgidum subsp. durum TaxID=4567 RepID=A0A9R0UZI8_TRITD|nr:unnamed protein product [Triticum turgidum subsp. durum]
MAAGNQRKCLFVVIKDRKPDYFVCSMNIEHMFQSGPSRGAAVEIRSLPSPMGQIPKPLPSPMGQIPKPLANPERIDFALAGDGATLVGVSNLKRTVLYDTRSGATLTGPELQHDKTGGTFVIPLGRRLYALKCRLNRVDGRPHYFIHLMAVQIIKTSTGSGSGKKQLRMVKRGVCCYEMPSHGLMAHVF